MKTEKEITSVIAGAVRQAARISVTNAWEGAYTSLNEAQIAQAVLKALADMPMRCDCTKRFEDWPLSDQLIAKARETLR